MSKFLANVILEECPEYGRCITKNLQSYITEDISKAIEFFKNKYEYQEASYNAREMSLVLRKFYRLDGGSDIITITFEEVIEI